MVTADQRTDKYKAKVNGNVFKVRYDDTKELAVRKERAAAIKQEEIEVKVKTICSGVSSILLHAYIIFANEFWKHHEDSERNIIYEKWKKRGLNIDLLDFIGEKLFAWRTSPSWIWDETSFWDINRFW